MSGSDTIYALATPPGAGAVAVVRVSGPAALQSLAEMTRATPPPSHMARLRRIRDPETGESLDAALVIVFAAPGSYTGEDVVEYHLHGSRAVVAGLLEALSQRAGHRMAEPGEFTRRAFLNGRMDLTEAEAVADLIDAATARQREQALDQLSGALSRLYAGWADRLTRILAHAEAHLDFPEEDVPGDLLESCRAPVREILGRMRAHLADNRRGERLRDGVRVCVLGAPNAGKSSLVNLLARREVAIVSDLAGTTRDLIEVPLDIAGFPACVIDTAGLRPDDLAATASGDPHHRIEREGIRRALEAAQAADIRLIVLDGGRLPDLDPHSLALIEGPALVCVNKSELADTIPAQIRGKTVIPLSVHAETGIDRLLEALKTQLEAMLGHREGPGLTRSRHRDALADCAAHLEQGQEAPAPELMAEDLRLALRALGRITGRVDVEDLLDVIFRDFCIGK